MFAVYSSSEELDLDDVMDIELDVPISSVPDCVPTSTCCLSLEVYTHIHTHTYVHVTCLYDLNDLCFLCQDEHSWGTPVKVQKTDCTAEPGMS